MPSQRVPAQISYSRVDQNFYFNLEQYPHRYYLELVVGEREKIIDVVEMPLVQGIRASSPHALVATETANGHWAESEGFRVRHFVITGRSGYTSVHLERYHRFKNFIERAVALAAENSNAFVRGEDYRVVLNFPWEGESYYCHPLNRVYDRQRARQSLSLDWSCSFRTYGFATRKWSVAKNRRAYLLSTCGPDDDNCHIGPRHPCRWRAFEATFEEAPPSIYSEVQKCMVPVFAQADRVVEEMSGYDSISTGSSAPLEAIANLYGLSALAYETIYEAAMAIDDINRDFLTPVLGWLSNVMMECKLAYGSRGKTLPFQIADYVTNGAAGEVRAAAMRLWDTLAMGVDAMYRSWFESSRQGPQNSEAVREYSVVEATTLASDSTILDAAERIVGIREVGYVAMRLMGMLDERTLANGGPLEPGTIIKLPRLTGLLNADNLNGDDWLVVNGDFVMNESGDDFVRVTGDACYLQNLYHRLLTVKGEYPLRPDVGLLDLGDLMDPNLNVGRLIADVKGQVMADHRTTQIKSMRYTDKPGIAEVDVLLEAVTSSRGQLGVSVALPVTEG